MLNVQSRERWEKYAGLADSKSAYTAALYKKKNVEV